MKAGNLRHAILSSMRSLLVHTTMPHDLDIIAQLEQQIGRALPRLKQIEIHWWTAPIGYTLNQRGEVNGLSLYETKISDIESLPALSSLQTLNLSRNQLTDVTALQALSRLQKLDLSYNQLTDVTALQALSSLQKLGLSHNQLTDLTALQALTSLQTLDLAGNQLTDVTALQALTSLQELNLAGNQLTDVTALQALTSLQELNLAGNQLTDVTALQALTSLQTLYLSRNQLTDVTAIQALTSLQTLDLSESQLTDVTAIQALTSLQTLDLSESQLTDVSALQGLTNLKKLDLRLNQLTDVSALQGLTNLQTLNLSENQLTDVSALQGLTNLQTLDLSWNKLTVLSALQGLSSLQALYLGGNQLTDVSALQALTNLQTLYLNKNQLTDVSALQGLSNLQALYLGGNQLTDVSALQALTNLQTLYLNKNQLTDVSALHGLRNLQRLDLGENCITRLPSNLLVLKMDIVWDIVWEPLLEVKEGINLYENPFEDPPVEIVKQGKAAILAYFESRDKRPLNEVKVLVLGDGEAGKTSLIKCFFDEPFDEQQPKTPGIALREQEWHVEIRERQFEQNLKVRFWDFGGQQIMHATHQFFLSERSVYLLVLDNRKDEQPEYWLRHILSFGGASPILLVINKLDEHRPAQCDPAALQAQFPQIRGVYRTSCKSGEGIAELTEGLRRTLPDAELVQTKLAASWLAVKNRLEERTESWISYETYLDLCEQEAVSDKAAQTTLLGFLHDLGVVLHFPDVLGLRHTHVLNPRWVTTAVYKLITAEQVASEHGLLRLNDLDTLLRPRSGDDFSYPRAAHPYIIDLMKKFELCFPLNDETVLIPDLLNPAKPAFAFQEDALLRFRLRYEFLPRSIMPRFIARMYRDIKDELRWRAGVVLEDRGLQACAMAGVNYETKTFALTVSGSQRREYLAILRKTLRDIHNTFKNLRPVELIPLPDHPDIEVEYEELIGLERMGESFKVIGKLGKRYNVRELLGAVFTESELSRLTSKVDRLYELTETIDRKQDEQLSLLHGLVNVMNELRGQLRAGQIDEDAFCAKVSDEIERRFRQIDFRYIQRKLTNDFAYLQTFDFSQKYGRFLLTAEYLYEESLCGRMQLDELDASTIIIEYAKIVDGILQDNVSKRMNKAVRKSLRERPKNPIREPYTLGTWSLLTQCDEYTDWVRQIFERDPALRAFLQADVGGLTETIKCQRNSAAHSQPHTFAEAREMRTALLETPDRQGKTLLEWCVKILEYQ